jgi:hypothetical protein
MPRSLHDETERNLMDCTRCGATPWDNCKLPLGQNCVAPKRERMTLFDAMKKYLRAKADMIEAENEIMRLTGKSPQEALAGMARLVEPVEGYAPGSLGDMMIRGQEL